MPNIIQALDAPFVTQAAVELTPDYAIRPERPNRPFQKNASLLTRNILEQGYDGIEFESDQE